MSDTKHSESDNRPSNFIRNIIDEDLRNNKNDGRVVTRFPPEP
ncbi:Glutaminyl-tRNA synthetase, partial [hydrothermal vent metagenome]